MNPLRISVLLVVAALWTSSASAQLIPRCLHGQSETQVQAQRRNEALDAADLINRMLARRPRGGAYPTWDALATSEAVSSIRSIAGRRGDLARKMLWGTDQPLPGWGIHYVAAQDGYAFSLTDMRDPCQLTVASNDTDVVIQGLPADRRGQPRTIPLDSTH
jgi:hypothetical protein